MKESHLERRQNDILQMEAEIQELMRMLRVNEITQAALKEETRAKRNEMRYLCKHSKMTITIYLLDIINVIVFPLRKMYKSCFF